MTRVIYMVFAILMALAGLAFHVRNNQEISLDYFVGSVNVDLSWVVVATLVAGALMGTVCMTSKVLQLRREVRRMNRRTEQATRELSSLRAIALKDGG